MAGVEERTPTAAMKFEIAMKDNSAA